MPRTKASSSEKKAETVEKKTVDSENTDNKETKKAPVKKAPAKKTTGTTKKTTTSKKKTSTKSTSAKSTSTKTSKTSSSKAKAEKTNVENKDVKAAVSQKENNVLLEKDNNVDKKTESSAKVEDTVFDDGIEVVENEDIFVEKTQNNEITVLENSMEVLNSNKSLNGQNPAQDIDESNNNTVIKEIIYIDKAKEKKEAKKKEREKLKVLKQQKQEAKKQRKKIKKKGLKALNRYDTDIEQGLPNSIVKQRFLEGLNNYVDNGSTKSNLSIILKNILTFFNILCLAIAGWIISINDWKDLIFLAMVVANTVVGIIQEIRAKKTINRLSILSAPTASVIRDGKQMEIPVHEVVLDDLLLLENGKQICTDALVVSGSIEVNESLLTGESDSIVKKVGDILYSGSYVVSGKCKAQVEHVGESNYIEKLTSQAKKYVKPKSDLWHSLSIIIIFMTCIIIPIGATLFYVQYFKGGLPYPKAVAGTAGAVIGMIPSGLWLTTSVALYVGVIKLGDNNVLVQELFCIEMLSRIDTLCLDKTGTITDGTMSVKNFIDYTELPGLKTEQIMSAYLNAHQDNNMTNKALEERFGLATKFKVLDKISFSSSRKYSAVTFEDYDTFILGAPEFILKDRYKILEKDVTKYAKMGYRVLLLAHTDDSIVDDKIKNEKKIKPISLILIEDNVRPDAVETINYFKESGVEVKVISGDNPLTVSKISERAGIRNATKYISLDGLSDKEVELAAEEYTVFGRVSPGQKRLLVKTLKAANHTVAMTGDGVNDILALKEADCSIAVASGSEAARNVSHLVLLDSNFASMPKVVAEGRRVINNVSKVARLYLTKTMFSLFLAIQAIIKGGQYPIRTSQLFLCDFFCIGVPSFILILEANNVKVKGKFLNQVIKGALPGALVILIYSALIFLLEDTFSMENRIKSTMIVITVTFVELMVLYEVAKPFNLLRRLTYIGSTLAIFIGIIFFCRYFEFNPLFDFVSYQDDVERIKPKEYPTVEISENGYFVIDGKLTTYIGQNSDKQVETIVNNYLYVNDKYTGYKVNIPSVSISSDGNYAIGEFKTKVEGTVDDLEKAVLSVSPTGDVSINGTLTEYNIFPDVEVYENTYYVNGLNTKIKAQDSKKLTVEITSDWRLKINGEIYSTVNDETEVRLIQKPLISISSDNYYYLGGNETNVSYVDLNNDRTPFVDLTENGNYTFDENLNDEIPATVSSTIISLPEVEISTSGKIVVNNIMTDKDYVGSFNNISTKVNSEGRVKVNGVDTGVDIDVESYTEYGYVQRLPLDCAMLLAIMCLLALPLMRFLRGIVPWIKKQGQNISRYLNQL